MFDRVAGERDEAWIVTAVRRRWWVVLLVAAIATASAYAIAKHQQKKYTASSALLFLTSNLDQELVSKQIVPTTDPTRQAATNQSLIELPTIARMVASQLRVTPAHVRSDLAFSSDATSDVVTVSVTDANRALAAAIANAYVKDYIQFRKKAGIDELNNAENLINRKLAKIFLSGKSSPVTQQLIADRNQIDLLKSAQTGDAQVVQTAGIPLSPSSPKPKQDAIIGLLLGVLVGGALVGGLERRDRRIRRPDQVEQVYGVPVIGTVPESPSLRRLRPLRALGRREEEAFLMLRAQVRYFDVDREVKRVLVTSADSGEGKTMVSLHLARAAARADDKRVLLIEADMRRPALSRLIGRNGVAGLSELLAHSQDVESGLRELVVTPGQFEDNGPPLHLDVLLAGSMPPNPSELLDSDRMLQVLEAADALYDIVILDTAPVGAVSDAMPLVHRVDGVLVITRMGRSRRDHALRLMKWLRALKAPVLGVVINSFKPSSDQSYGYYGSYGYRQSRRRRGARPKVRS